MFYLRKLIKPIKKHGLRYKHGSPRQRYDPRIRKRIHRYSPSEIISISPIKKIKFRLKRYKINN